MSASVDPLNQSPPCFVPLSPSDSSIPSSFAIAAALPMLCVPNFFAAPLFRLQPGRFYAAFVNGILIRDLLAR